MYKGKKFKIRPVEDIKEDILSAKSLYGDHVRTIFLADGNAVIMKTPQLLDIVNFCYAMFPNLERITSYGAAKIINKTKSLEELKELKKAGLSRIHMGLESGDDETLNRICKGATAKEMIEASKKVKEAGMELSQYVLLGIGGSKHWMQHAQETAKVLNEMDPDFIRVRTLILMAGAPLFETYKAGDFEPSSPLDVLQETKIIIENLDVSSMFCSDHVSNYVMLDGKLPEEREKLLTKLNAYIQELKENPDRLARLEAQDRCKYL
jgi:radical SAM superfamily enzyme YgiQ (UPF0313 family)